jgi:RNA polymerase sigma-70 factor (ECF subfamily)
MDAEQRQSLEAEIREYWSRGDIDRSATTAIRGYGPEVLGFLVALHKNEQEASDAFAVWSEHVWRGMPSFAWECSFRTWAYTVARNASWHCRQGERKRQRRQVAFSSCPAVAEMEIRVRTQTLPFLRTETKNRIAELRDELPEDDKVLLILRVDRRLAWVDLARVLLGQRPDAARDEAAVKREAARLRKRFQLVKEKLAKLAEREGLVAVEEET